VKRLDDCPFLPRDQWDIYRGPDEMLYESRSYEYARQSPERAIAVSRWRGHAKEQSFESYLALYQNPQAPKPPSVVLGDDLYALLPEWPSRAFHRIDATPLTRCLEQLYPWHEQELRARRFDPDPLLSMSDYAIDRCLLRLRENWKRFTRWILHPGHIRETHLLSIDWWDSDANLARDFQLWLKKNRPPDCQPCVQQGAGAYERQWRSDLKALAAFRLWKKSNGNWFDCPPLFLNEADWRIAVKRAEDLIARTYPVAL
jgi:hypothetical protein